MYKEIDIDKWERGEIYRHFLATRMPHYALAANVDVTRLIEYKRRHGLSFYLSLIYLATEALNSIDNFRMRMVGGRPVIFDEVHPYLTHKRPGETIFHFYTGRRETSLKTFVEKTSEGMAGQTTLFGGYEPSQDLVYFSCNPMVDATAITNPCLDDPEDAIPRVNWGKYVEHDGRWTINITVTPNHRFIDGLHVGMFFERLQKLIDQL